MAPQSEQLLKFSVQHYRQKGVSEEDFLKWLTAVHVPIASKIIKKHNVVKYSITLNPVAMQQAFGRELQTSLGKPPGWVMADYDAVTNYWVRDAEDLRQLMADQEWAEKVSTDERSWVDLERATIFAGFETVFIEEGEFVTREA